jgi:hypothetical protein
MNSIKLLVYNVKHSRIETRTFRNEQIFEAWFNNVNPETEYTIIEFIK